MAEALIALNPPTAIVVALLTAGPWSTIYRWEVGRQPIPPSVAELVERIAAELSPA